MSLKIRGAKISDLPYVYNICVKTGKSGEDATDLLSDPHIIGQYFAAPYLHFEIESCLILEDKNKPIGYIIGCINSAGFNKWMNDFWLPEIAHKYPPDYKCMNDFERFIVNKINSSVSDQDYFEQYPSQLHIDLLPEAQGRGFGKKLINEFINLLKKGGSKGLHLGVGLNNKNAIAFYQKTGFHIIREEKGALILGMKF